MKRLDSFFPDFLRSIASNEELTLIFLQELWPQLAGKELAEKTTPVALQNKSLVVTVPSEIWAKQLRELRQMLLRSINGFWDFPLLQSIRLRVDDGNGSGE